MSRRATWCLLWSIGCAGGAETGGPTGVASAGECPANTRFSAARQEDVVAEGGVLYVTETRTSLCVPERPCVAPFVPVVTAEAGLTCEALPDFGLSPDSEVDFTFADGAP